MDEDWKNTFGNLMCMEICDGAGAGICDVMPLTCSSFIFHHSSQTQSNQDLLISVFHLFCISKESILWNI